MVIGFLLPLLLLWAATSGAVAYAAHALASRGPDTGRRLGPEAWMAFAAAGAAVGGFLAVSALLPDVVDGGELRSPVGPVLVYATPGMLIGAAFAAGVAGAVLYLRDGEGD